MTVPTFEPAEPLGPSTPDVGPTPNYSDTGPSESEPQPRKHTFSGNRQKNAGKSPFATLGKNKKARSGVRKLVDEDLEKLADLYRTVGMFLMPVKPAAGRALMENADKCAQAWGKLAEENDSVRRTVLMLVEGSAWGALLTAHMPILLTLLPMEKIGERISSQFFSKNDDDGDEMADAFANMFGQQG